MLPDKISQKILIVDSTEEIRDSLKSVLKNENYEVYTAPLVKDALEVTRDVPIGVVITEVNMPDLTGIEILHKFKHLKDDVSVIVMTSSDSVQLAVDAMKEGAYDYITKPFNLEEIKFIVGRALERKFLLAEAKEKQIYQELALLDPLTGVYNRRYFEELMRREINRGRRYGENVAVIIFDIDDFKKCNDTFGHGGGDHILKQLAGLAVDNVRCTDFVCRYGGDEFVIIAPHSDKKGGSVLGYRLLSIVAKHVFSFEDDKKPGITISGGLAVFPMDGENRDDLMQSADKALYEAKKLGKNRFCLFGGD